MVADWISWVRRVQLPASVIGRLVRSVLPVLQVLSASPVKDLNAAALRNRPGSSHRGQQLAGSYQA
jgi:hypothetical protein